jgi:DNA replication initiation complex subunit (GINS family)
VKPVVQFIQDARIKPLATENKTKEGKSQQKRSKQKDSGNWLICDWFTP